MRADDFTRPWRQDSNALTDTIAPGAFLQEAIETVHVPEENKRGAFELKVEVLWGRAYLAAFQFGGVEPGGFDTKVHLRRESAPFGPAANGSGIDGSQIRIEASTYAESLIGASHLVNASDDFWAARWLMADQRHIECAFSLAERAARAIGADWIRWDILLIPSKPMECVINENSLSSGQRYGQHGEALVQLWLTPYRKKWSYQRGSLRSRLP